MSTLKVNNVQSITKYPPLIFGPGANVEIGKLASSWVAFTDDGTILNSNGVISITAHGSAIYTISFTPGLRINNPAVAGSSNASTNIVHPVIFANNDINRNQQYAFSSEVRIAMRNNQNGTTTSAQENSTYHTITVIGDNAYASAGNLIIQ